MNRRQGLDPGVTVGDPTGLPESRPGSSSAETFTRQQSMPRPARALAACSTIWTVAPATARFVRAAAATRFSTASGIRTGTPPTCRRKAIPEPAAAGRNSTRQGRPLQ